MSESDKPHMQKYINLEEIQGRYIQKKLDPTLLEMVTYTRMPDAAMLQ